MIEIGTLSQALTITHDPILYPVLKSALPNTASIPTFFFFLFLCIGNSIRRRASTFATTKKKKTEPFGPIQSQLNRIYRTAAPFRSSDAWTHQTTSVHKARWQHVSCWAAHVRKHSSDCLDRFHFDPARLSRDSAGIGFHSQRIVHKYEIKLATRVRIRKSGNSVANLNVGNRPGDGTIRAK